MKRSPALVDHFQHPRNVGALPAAPDVGVVMVRSTVCGSLMKLAIRVGPGGTIEEARFKLFGCSVAIACGSYVTDWLKGRSVSEAGALDASELETGLDLPDERRHCAALAIDAVRAAIAAWRGR
jgi:nitrogen fixation NifU-like protein